MSPVPVVSIVVPVFDDASTDATAGIIEQVALSDPRVRLVHHDDNRTAFQARRTGILTARGEYVLFLDGDDELAPRAAEVAGGRAQESGADIVGFGVDVVERDGRTGGTYERRLQPAHDRRDGSDVLTGLFTEGGHAQGQLWRHLYRTSLLREAYALVPDDLALARVNDLPLLFLAAALAVERSRRERHHQDHGDAENCTRRGDPHPQTRCRGSGGHALQSTDAVPRPGAAHDEGAGHRTMCGPDPCR